MRLTNNYSGGFIGHNWGSIAAATCIVPLAVEVGYLGYSAIKNRAEVQERVISLSRRVVHSFRRREEESLLHYRLRIAKNVAVTLLAVAAISGVSTAAFCVLPAMLAIPIAISTILLAGKGLYHCDEVKARVIAMKDFFVSSCVRREDETKKEFVKRLAKNVVITVLFLGAVGGVAAAAFTQLPIVLAIPVFLVAASMLMEGFVKRREIVRGFVPRDDESRGEAAKRIAQNVLRALLIVGGIALALFVLPSIAGQWDSLLSGELWAKITGSTAVLLAEHFLVGVAHFLLATYHFARSNKSAGCFHLSCGILSFVLPLIRVANGATLRMHHDFLGLLMSLVPLRPVQMVGAAYTVDSMMYHVGINGGGLRDFADIMVENADVILPCVAFGCVFQLVSGVVSSARKDEKDGEKPLE